MRKTETDYDGMARDDARDTAINFLDDIVEQIISNGEAEKNLYYYPDGDSYHHESHVDRYYDLSEAADILDQLADHEETDSGLWESLEPRRAICVQAAYTYANAVMYYWSRIIREINDGNPGLEDALTDLAEEDPAVTEDTIRDIVKGIIESW